MEKYLDNYRYPDCETLRGLKELTPEQKATELLNDIYDAIHDEVESNDSQSFIRITGERFIDLPSIEQAKSNDLVLSLVLDNLEHNGFKISIERNELQTYRKTNGYIIVSWL